VVFGFTHGNQFLDIANPVAEPLEATIFVSLFLWSFRCFDKLSNHKAQQPQAQRPFQQAQTTILFKKSSKNYK